MTCAIFVELVLGAFLMIYILYGPTDRDGDLGFHYLKPNIKTMEKIKVSDFKRKSRAAKPAMTFAATRIILNNPAAALIFGKIGDKHLIELSYDADGTLLVRPGREDDPDALLMRPNSGQFQAYCSSLSSHVKERAGFTRTNMTCPVAKVREDGWHPVITTAWKTASVNKC